MEDFKTIEESLEKLNADIKDFAESKSLVFKVITPFTLNSEVTLEEKLKNLNVKGIYFLEIKKNNEYQSFDAWSKDFKKKWDNDKIIKTPKIAEGRLKMRPQSENIDSLEWIPFYIGKSEKIKDRVVQHLTKPIDSTTSALKLRGRKSLYGMEFRLSVIEINTDKYDLVMHKIEQILRNKYNPIVGKH